MACFDLALLAQVFDDGREIIRVQLSRWKKQHKVIGLRRGMYTLADTYRHASVVPAALAKQLYRPSYLSGLWALGYYDLIPERVVWLTSVTPRVPRHFENEIGVFEYRSIKQTAFFGYKSASYGEAEIYVAEPEKALLDYLYLTQGEWTTDRLTEMRYQNVERVDCHLLEASAKRFKSPRLLRAVERWRMIAASSERGTVTL